MLTATLAVSALVLSATVLHMRSEMRNKPISMKELWKIRGYQEDDVRDQNCTYCA